ncbi:T9SS type A sorting domain-containing protein [Wenyingzhuangia aestuarii]|uniref:T9SS type A sorting domain-containing protein n=1 Tax=Wenyingzhuangia aestuarii TaxID=1647582 RepID=UPI00143BF00B|nr:T9SS type A sorting domain-containing protein [Wenyingzhuangia aestuarii]NJB82270.1 hypothetical protein [Wenyingzhuangia aestuarii]
MQLKTTLVKNILKQVSIFGLLFITSVLYAQDPNAPTGLTTSDGTPNEFTLSWDADANATGGYNIFIVEGTSGDVYITTVPAGTTSYTYSGTYGSITITDGNTYTAKIQALPDGNYNAYADTTVTVNATPPQDPEAPTGLVATDSALNQFTLSWEADANATGGYNIFIVEGTSGDVYITTVPAGTNSYTYSGTYGSVTVANGNTYTAKIQALPDGNYNAYADLEVTVGSLSVNNLNSMGLVSYYQANNIHIEGDADSLNGITTHIYTITGKLIQSTNNTTINVEELTDGVYILVIENNKGQKASKKILKN